MEVRSDTHVLILDAGTGIRGLGQQLRLEGKREFDLLISHPHIDHLQGFPFFLPAYDSATRIRIHMSWRKGRPGSEAFDKMMEAPHFPVVFRDLPARIEFHRLDGQTQIGPFRIATHALNHPGGNTAFRLEHGGKCLVYLTDHEPYCRANGSNREASQKDQAVADFQCGADLLIRECQYTLDEYAEHRGWGHGTFEDAFSSARDSGVRRLALFHHDPDHDDDFLERSLEILQNGCHSGGMEVFLAREGERVDLVEERIEAA